MNNKKALKIARKYLCEEIELEVHSELSKDGAVYPYNPENKILTSF
ncbi:MAG: hypothetical protein U5K69_24830 [Balneolaceae bacterium]|nr:hypothetical protein [Balneolaceae bacterium]